ncbi:MAG: hypothetical protein KDI36_03320 [Pseudomonadales bacterium]|nr:hypothetical protein [Pseudomonadales bacterium]
MLSVPTVMVTAFVMLLAWWLFHRYNISRREAYIEHYRFPERLRQAIQQKYPHLSAEDVAWVIMGLREYFQICNQAGRRMVAMPSQVIDVAWHEFILFTREYQKFCKSGLGRFLHHTPAEAMHSATQAQKGIRNAWYYACQREGIPAKRPTTLPLLFAIDNDLGIADGFTYHLNCEKAADGYCAGHIGCGGSGGCGGDTDGGCGGGCGGD